MSSTLERPDKNSTLFTSSKGGDRSEKKYMSNTTKFWNLKMWKKENPSQGNYLIHPSVDMKNYATISTHFHSAKRKKRRSISGTFKRTGKKDKIKISFFDLKGKDL